MSFRDDGKRGQVDLMALLGETTTNLPNAIRKLGKSTSKWADSRPDYKLLSVGVQWVSPEQAKRWVETDIEGERNIKPSQVAKHLRQMKEDYEEGCCKRFVLSWDPIVFGSDVRRQNARNRLRALAQMPDDYRAPFLVIRNAPKDMHLVGDQGRKRTAADQAKRHRPEQDKHAEREACYARIYDIVVSAGHSVDYVELHEKLEPRFGRFVEAVLSYPASENKTKTGVDSNVRAAVAVASSIPKYRSVVSRFMDEFLYGARGKSLGRDLQKKLTDKTLEFSPPEKLQMTLYALQQQIQCEGNPKQYLKVGKRGETHPRTGELFADLYDAAVQFFKSSAIK